SSTKPTGPRPTPLATASLIIKPHINSTFFRPLFDTIIGDQKSKIISSAQDMRAEIYASIPDLDGLIFSAEEPLKAMAQNSVCVYLCSATKETPYAPIVYAPGKAGNLKYLFKTATVANMIRLMLFGKGSLKDKTRKPDRKTYGMTLGIKALNCHMIAFGVVRYLLSGDEDFDLVGSPSGYPYQREYEEFMRYLIRAWQRPRVKFIHEYLEDEVFKNVWEKSSQVHDGATPTHPIQLTEEDLLELEDADSDSDPGPPTTDTDVTAALAHEPTGPIVPAIRVAPESTRVTPASLGVDLSITPTLANITIEDPGPARRAESVQPRLLNPSTTANPDLGPVEEVQTWAAEHAAQPLPSVPAKKARSGRQPKAGKARQDAGGTAVGAVGGAPSSATSIKQIPPAPRRTSTRTKKTAAQ
ncbi:hypothetical protein GY45DRAFT_1411307, partial [Cubamyces sp. BRFM 1775]